MTIKTIQKLVLALLLFATSSISYSQQPSTGLYLMSDDSIAVAKYAHYEKLGFEKLPVFASNGVIITGKYVAIDDYLIKRGSVVTIAENTEIIFEPGVALTVDGTLIAKKGVQLSNVPKGFLLPARADSLWYGVKVNKSGSVNFDKIKIQNAVQGIYVTGEPDSFRLNCVDISNVRYNSFSFGTSTMAQKDTFCLNFDYQKISQSSVTPLSRLSSDNKNKSLYPMKQFFKYSAFASGFTMIASAVVWKVFYDKAAKSTVKSEIPELEQISNIALTTCAISGGCTVITGASLGILLGIELKRKKK